MCSSEISALYIVSSRQEGPLKNGFQMKTWISWESSWAKETVYRAEIFGKDTSLVVLSVVKISEFYLGAIMSYEAPKLLEKTILAILFDS